MPIIVQHRLNLKSRKCGWTERLAIQSIKATWPSLSRKVASAHREKQLAQVSDFRAASFSCVFVCVALCFLSFDALEIKSLSSTSSTSSTSLLIVRLNMQMWFGGGAQNCRRGGFHGKKDIVLAFSNEERTPND